jgi:ankyrin repeat protein
VPHSPPQAKKLPARPNLGYLKKLAKERLVELRRHHPASKLADAQLAVARDHGFESWRKLRADVVATLFQAALDDGDAKAMADLVRNYPSSALQRAALWTHPSGKRLPLPPLLIAACFRKNIDLVRALLDAGADPNSPALFVDGRPDIMTLLFDRGMNPNAMTHPENCTGLMYAAFVDDVENTELLLSRSADPNVVLPNCGTRALHWLPWRGENKTPDRTIAVGRMLIQSGADVNARIHTGLRDQPITDAGNLYLIEHGGSTVLHTAAEKGMLDLVRFLLEAGADPELRTTGNLLNRATLQYSHHLPGDRPLELAAAAGKLEVATLSGTSSS